VIGQRVVQLRQLADDVQWRVLARGPGAGLDTDAAALREYFNVSISHVKSAQWLRFLQGMHVRSSICMNGTSHGKSIMQQHSQTAACAYLTQHFNPAAVLSVHRVTPKTHWPCHSVIVILPLKQTDNTPAA
jgi:hypothetical protein